jgi:hypothetical protein
MATIATIPEIEKGLLDAKIAFYNFCGALNDEQFFHQPSGKWSPAQQVKHLIISADKTRLAYQLPKFIVRLYTGKPNRPSRSYDELVQRYKTKLAQGGKASAAFVPKELRTEYGKNNLMIEFNRSMDKLSSSIHKNLSESQSDNYLAPHPLLGKITLRELGFFTIHHTYHHLESIQKMTKPL